MFETKSVEGCSLALFVSFASFLGIREGHILDLICKVVPNHTASLVCLRSMGLQSRSHYSPTIARLSLRQTKAKLKESLSDMKSGC